MVDYMILLEYIETEKYGKLAHFLTDDNIDLFSKVIEENGDIIYSELSDEEQEELRKELLDDKA